MGGGTGGGTGWCIDLDRKSLVELFELGEGGNEGPS